MRAHLLLTLLVLAASAMASACTLQVDYSHSAFLCDNGACPDGFVCSTTLVCVAIEGGSDGADATPSDASDVPDADVANVPDAPPGTPDARPLPDAAVSTCRNGTVEAGEQCDDGNSVDTDACRNNCRWATCGDGVVRTGVEECDDGNTTNGDTCSETCQRCVGGVTNDANGHCYVFPSGTMPWYDAVDTCIAKGGYLASLTDPAELVFASLHAPGFPYWTGLNDIDSEGTYVWYDQEPQADATIPWTANQPNGGNDNNDCVWAESSGFNDLGCSTSTTARALCEIDGWHVRPTDGHAYRFVDLADSSQTLEGQCQALGAHLATIDASGEANFLAGFATGTYWVGPAGGGGGQQWNCKTVDLYDGSGTATMGSCWSSNFGVCELP